MARHLLISDGTASAVSSGVEADGAIAVQKLSATGPTDVVPEIRFQILHKLDLCRELVPKTL